MSNTEKCMKITYKSECEYAASQMGLEDTTATEINLSDRPMYCYYYYGHHDTRGDIRILYYNKNYNSIDGDYNHRRICHQ